MAEADPLVGQTLLGKLRVIRQLGGGGMGAVYEVVHLMTGHRRALKIVPFAEIRSRATMTQRVLREASIAGKVRSEYIPETFDAGTLEDGSVYVLMELLEGRSLAQIVEQEQRLGTARLVALVLQLCEALAQAHGAGIIHRDLKPENIFVVVKDGRERVKLLDFGISLLHDAARAPTRLTEDGLILGTPFYMSPEQASGDPVDARADVYSMGVLMYECLSGELPFQAATIAALFMRVHEGKYRPLRELLPDLSPELAAVIAKAMHSRRDARFATVLELREALLPFVGSETSRVSATLAEFARPRLLDVHTQGEPTEPDISGIGQHLATERRSSPTPNNAARSMGYGRLPIRSLAPAIAAAVALVGGALLAFFLLVRTPEIEPPQVVSRTVPQPVVQLKRESAATMPSPPPLVPNGAASAPLRSQTKASPKPSRHTPAAQAGLDPNPYR